MFDTLDVDPGAVPDDPGPDFVPLERLEAQICELAGHLAAATGPMTGNQLERFARAHRQVSSADAVKVLGRVVMSMHVNDHRGSCGALMPDI